MEILLILLGVPMVLSLAWWVLHTLDEGTWKRQDGTQKFLKKQEQAMRIQRLEHDVEMLPHADQEMTHLCKTCAWQEERELQHQRIVEESWKPYTGRGWRPAGVGRNLYPDREQVEVTSFGDDVPRFVPGRALSYLQTISLMEEQQRRIAGIPPPMIDIPEPPFPTAPPGITRK